MMLMTMISLNMQPSKSVFVDARVGASSTRHLKLPDAVRQRSTVDYGGPVSPTPRYTSLEVASGLISVPMAGHVEWGVPHTKVGGGHGPGSNPDSFSLSLSVVD